MVVLVALRGQGLVSHRAHLGQQFLGGGLAVATGDTDDLSAEPVPVPG